MDEIMSAEKEQEARDLIIAEAHKLYKTPFRHRGRTRKGVDCAGFIYLAYHRAGIEVPSSDGKMYEPNWFWFIKEGDERYLDTMLKYFRYIEFPEQPKIGDLATFKRYGNIVTHAGIIDKNGQFIHAESGRYVTFTELEHRYYKSRFHRFLRYRGFK
jgi:cell wall-associated NlpC family hydrolase